MTNKTGCFSCVGLHYLKHSFKVGLANLGLFTNQRPLAWMTGQGGIKRCYSFISLHRLKMMFWLMKAYETSCFIVLCAVFHYMRGLYVCL